MTAGSSVCELISRSLGDRFVLPTSMRAVWCLLLLLMVLAPAGSVGITTAPAEAETVLTAPRAMASASIERRDSIEATAPAALPLLVAPRTLTSPVPSSARPLLPADLVRVANPRGPPA
jgi:hypothetical protein